MLDFQLWRLHETLNEANAIIHDVNCLLVAQKRRKWFWEDDRSSTPTVTKPDTQQRQQAPEPKKLSVDEARSKLPELGYLLKRKDGQPGAQSFIDIEKTRIKDTAGAEKAGIRACLIRAFKDEQAVQRDGIRFPPGVIVNKINHRVFNYDEIQDKITELVDKNELDCCDAIKLRMRLKDKMHQLGLEVLDMIKFPLKVGGGVEVDGPDTYSTLDRFYRRDIGELRTQQGISGCGDCGGGRSSARWQAPVQQRQTQQRFAGSGFRGGRR